MSQSGVQLVIGKLLTDEEFRHGFEQRRRESLVKLREQGIDLADAEIAVLAEEDPILWSKMAARIDRRLKRPDAGHAPRPLTVREQDVLRGVFEGLTNKQIASHLGVSEGAIKATLQQLFRKTNVRTRAQLVRIVMERSLGVAVDRR